MVTGFVDGVTSFSTPPQNQHPLPIAKKFCMAIRSAIPIQIPTLVQIHPWRLVGIIINIILFIPTFWELIYRSEGSAAFHTGSEITDGTSTSVSMQ